MLQCRMVCKKFQGIIWDYVTGKNGNFQKKLMEVKEFLPNGTQSFIRRSKLWHNFKTREGKLFIMFKCLTWTEQGPQGPYSPYMYFIKKRLLTFHDLRKLHGINEVEYREYVDENWGLLGYEDRRVIKYEARAKNVISCILRGLDKSMLSGKKQKLIRNSRNFANRGTDENSRLEILMG